MCGAACRRKFSRPPLAPLERTGEGMIAGPPWPAAAMAAGAGWRAQPGAAAAHEFIPTNGCLTDW